MRAGEGDFVELRERDPDELGGEFRAGRADGVDRFGDLESRDAAAFRREEIGRLKCGGGEAEVLGGGKLVEVGEATGGGGGAMKEKGAVAFAPDAGDGALFDEFGREARIVFRVAALAGGAKRADGAREAERFLAEADGGAEFHHRLVVIAGRLEREEFVGERGERFCGGGGIAERRRVGGEPGENANDVAIDAGGGGVE